MERWDNTNWKPDLEQIEKSPQKKLEHLLRGREGREEMKLQEKSEENPVICHKSVREE